MVNNDMYRKDRASMGFGQRNQPVQFTGGLARLSTPMGAARDYVKVIRRP